LNDNIFQPNYPFNTSYTEFHYQIPDCQEHGKYLEYIGTMPEKDSPLIFGLHPNADLTFRLKESLEMINTLVDTQPKESSGSGGKSREDEVKEKLQKDLIPQLPDDFKEAEYTERIRTMKGPRGLSEVGMGVPLNVFLSQEI
jgi:dynein heavy chain